MNILVLGAGLQGCAAAYDLLQVPSVTRVTLADLNPARLPKFLQKPAAGQGPGRSLTLGQSKMTTTGMK